MKSTTKARLLLGVILLFGVEYGEAGVLSVPHGPEDQVIVYTYPMKFAHPTDYWWHLNPSESGSWDYFSPVDAVYAPIPVEQGAPGLRPPLILGVKANTLLGMRVNDHPNFYSGSSVTGTPLVFGTKK